MKLITDYEVEGCWPSKNRKTKNRCRKCGAILKPTPKEGHFNSKYWELEQDDGCHLVNCPKGCSEKSAVQSYRDFSKISYYCTKESESWKYELDYKEIINAWIDRKGKVYPVECREHISFAHSIDKSEQELEDDGWLKLSSKDFMWERKLSKQQIDFILEYLTYYKQSKSVFDKFEEVIDYDTHYFKLTKV